MPPLTARSDQRLTCVLKEVGHPQCGACTSPLLPRTSAGGIGVDPCRSADHRLGVPRVANLPDPSRLRPAGAGHWPPNGLVTWPPARVPDPSRRRLSPGTRSTRQGHIGAGSNNRSDPDYGNRCTLRPRGVDRPIAVVESHLFTCQQDMEANETASPQRGKRPSDGNFAERLLIRHEDVDRACLGSSSMVLRPGFSRAPAGRRAHCLCGEDSGEWAALSSTTAGHRACHAPVGREFRCATPWAVSCVRACWQGRFGQTAATRRVLRISSVWPHLCRTLPAQRKISELRAQ